MRKKFEVLRARRNRLRCSQYLIAKLAGLSRNRISLIECGYVEATTEELRKIHIALGKVEAELRKSPLLQESRNVGAGFGVSLEKSIRSKESFDGGGR